MNEGLTNELGMLISVMVSFFLGGGTVVLAIGILGGQLLKSPVVMTALENLARGAHPDTLKALNATAKVVDEVTDDVAYIDKLPKPPLVSVSS
jgi:hypothetical protein